MNAHALTAARGDAVLTPASAPSKPRPDTARGPARRKLLFAAAAAIVLVVVAGVAYWRLSSPAVIRYITAEIGEGMVAPAVTATGTVNPVLTIIVGTYVSGVIQQVYCDYNTEVKQGQICAKIDPRPYQTVVDQDKANLAVAQAQLEKDQANLAYAKLNYERNARLAETNAVAKDVADSAKNVYDQAQAQISYDKALIDQRQAELSAAQINLGYTDISSPVNGTVVSRNVTMGQTVAASFQTPTLFLIATDLTTMQVDTNVSESDIGDLKVGDTATFTVDAYSKRTFAGHVSQVRQSPQTVQNVVTYDVVVSADNTDLALKPGMTAATRITIDSRENVLRVPNQALRYRPSIGRTTQQRKLADGTARLWILRDGQPVAVTVTTGLDDENFTEIVSGDIKAGDLVITGEQGSGTTGANRPPALRLG